MKVVPKTSLFPHAANHTKDKPSNAIANSFFNFIFLLLINFLMHKFIDQTADKEPPIRFSKGQKTICGKISKPFIKEYF